MTRRTKRRGRIKRWPGRLAPTPEFVRFGSNFHRSILIDGETFEAVTLDIIKTFKGDERRMLRDFIKQILDSDLSYDQLNRLWRSTQAEWDMLDDKSYRSFLGLVHNRLCREL